jgi:general stress protein 26
MDYTDIQNVLASPVATRLLEGDELARPAYIATDGTPRVIPIGLFFDGLRLVVCTATNAAKVKALKANDKVALTIDTTRHPPSILLIRGTASLETVDGIPDEYLQENSNVVQEDAWDDLLAGVKSLYKQMVRITITPTWAKVIDFETTLPSAVEELVAERDG